MISRSIREGGVAPAAARGDPGDAVVRAEYLFAGGKAYGLRSSPA